MHFYWITKKYYVFGLASAKYELAHMIMPVVAISGFYVLVQSRCFNILHVAICCKVHVHAPCMHVLHFFSVDSVPRAQ